MGCQAGPPLITVQLRKECQRDDHQRSLTGNGEIPPRREQEHVTAEQDR